MPTLQELTLLSRREFVLNTKRHTFKVLEYDGDICKKCNCVMSHRAYYAEKETDFSINKALKQTIICSCGLKVILRNGVVFFNPDKHKKRPNGLPTVGFDRLNSGKLASSLPLGTPTEQQPSLLNNPSA